MEESRLSLFDHVQRRQLDVALVRIVDQMMWSPHKRGRVKLKRIINKLK